MDTRGRGSGSPVVDSDSHDRLAREPIGSYLRKQRTLRGITVEELSALTRIPLRSLERLEAGYFDDDVDGFVRGFVRTVAQALGLDPDETLSRMLTEARPEDFLDPHLSRALPRALVGLCALVLLVAGVGLVRFVVNGEPSAQTGDATHQTLYRRDPVRALAESAASERTSGGGERRPAPAAAVAPAAPRAADPGPTVLARDVAAPPHAR